MFDANIDVGPTQRAAWMRILSLSPWSGLQAAAGGLSGTPHRVLRAPETGLVMLRGRMGATGGAFNLGEATVTRCAVSLADGVEGHAYVMGRNAAHAHLAAICDALLQLPGHHAEVAETVIRPLEKSLQETHVMASTKAAATKVDFFTMVRGDV
jgi:alpha-D-ribose 1-methylphosphonate 5-triphosphate synthase subunit PhnG